MAPSIRISKDEYRNFRRVFRVCGHQKHQSHTTNNSNFIFRQHPIEFTHNIYSRHSWQCEDYDFFCYYITDTQKFRHVCVYVNIAHYILNGIRFLYSVPHSFVINCAVIESYTQHILRQQKVSVRFENHSDYRFNSSIRELFAWQFYMKYRKISVWSEKLGFLVFFLHKNEALGKLLTKSDRVTTKNWPNLCV